MAIRIEDINPLITPQSGNLSTTSVFERYKSRGTISDATIKVPSYTGTSEGVFSKYQTYKPTTSTSSYVLPTEQKTSGTFAEVSKALGGSFGAGVLNLISSAVGTMERQLVAGTDAEGIGITGM